MLAVHTYRDRVQAGRVLAHHLARFADDPGLLILGLARGGMPVAAQVAHALKASLDVFVVRKLGLPGHEEFAIGAIASGGVHLLDHRAVQRARVAPEEVEAITKREWRELTRREKTYRGERPPKLIGGRNVILVDDGVATGFSLRAAIAAIRQSDPARVIVAVPVGPPDTCEDLASEVDEVICPVQPIPFHAVGLWYEHFAATSDREVQLCLHDDAPRPPADR